MLVRLLIACFIIGCAPLSVGAQGEFDLAELNAPQHKLVVDPAYPEPGQAMTVKLDDYAGGVFGANITWRYNGEIVPDSTNLRSIELEAGALGSTNVIEAILDTPTNGQQSLRKEITPIYLDVIIEPQTRVPDWYAGRPMPSFTSQVNATALVNNGSFLDNQGLVYTWQVNRKVLDAGPVRARNKMSFVTPRGRDMIVSVTVAEAAGDIIASKAKRVTIASPELAFYEQHSLYGSQERPIDSSVSLIGNNLTIKAEPFFLDTRVYNDPDIALWEINAVETANGALNPYEITLQRSGGTGQTAVNFHVRSLQEVLQGAESNIRINF